MTFSNLLVEEIRATSRSMARDWGFMGGRFAGTDLSPPAVHALLEIEGGDTLAKDLITRLRLETPRVNRMLRELVDVDAIFEIDDASGNGIKPLSLTSNGKKLVATIHAHAKNQVERALQQLSPGQDISALKGLRLYTDALASQVGRRDDEPASPVVTGYQLGLVARITQMHMHFYGREFGFGQRFESLVAAGLADFSNRLDKHMNGIWTLMHRGEIAGSVAIDGEDLGEGIAHMRWFIVDDSLRGSGSGRMLLSAAVDFADQQRFHEVHLWTFSGLSAARHLYESYQFECVEEWSGGQWGKTVLEQRFVRKRPDLRSICP